jgi:hypothetical protein
MKFITPKKPTVIASITDFLTSDLLQEEIQNLPTELQELFDMLLDTEYGNCLQTRRKMLRIKEITTNFSKALAPFTEHEIQESCKNH